MYMQEHYRVKTAKITKTKKMHYQNNVFDSTLKNQQAKEWQAKLYETKPSTR